MPQLLELWDRSQPGVFASLPQVLSAFPPEAHALQWRILWLEPLAAPNSNLDLTPYGFGAHLANGFGLEATWADLEHLASVTVQIPDGLIVTPRPGCRPRATDSDDRLLALSTAVLARSTPRSGTCGCQTIGSLGSYRRSLISAQRGPARDR